jgi:hypothetical protein
MLDTLSLIGDRIIAYRPILRVMGISSTVNGTLLASQLLYLFQQSGRQPFAATDWDLAAQTGLSVDEVRYARADLVTRLGAESFFGYSLKGMPRQGWYHVDADRINSLTSKGNRIEANQNPPNPSIDQFGPRTEQVRATARASAGQDPNKFGPRAESSIYKNLLEDTKKKEEDPLKGPTEAAAKPEPKPKDPFAAKKLPIEAIPSDLLDCQELLPEFWAGKKGRRSERVFHRVCAKLRQWTPEGRRESLEAAIASGWGDVFPPRQAALPFGNGRSRVQPSRVQPKDEFIAGILAAEAAGMFSTTPTTP